MADYNFNVPKNVQVQPGAPGQPPIPIPQHQAIALNKGDYLFVLGANGTGKSSLMLSIYAPNYNNARRILAHRQNWFASGAVNITAQQRFEIGNNVQSRDSSADSRWKDDYAQYRATMAIYDLIDAENIRALDIAKAADQNDMPQVAKLAAKPSPVNKLNTILRLSNLPITLSIEAGARVMASRNGGSKYDVAELSDGERSALLIASNVLTVPNGTLLVIDEPERHLHRSIISPLLSLLFEERPDCAFVISTHDVLLAMDNPGSQKLLVRGCTHNDIKQVVAWDVDLVSPGGTIDDQLMRDVLGARRRVIFVEGTQSSLDLPLYAVMFPAVTVIPKSSCVDVQNAVSGLRGAAAGNPHWVEAFGIVDGDGRSPADIAALQLGGIYAVNSYSIESVYYHPEIQRRVADAQAALMGADANALTLAANAATVAAVQPHIDRLSARIVERDVRSNIVQLIPSHQALRANPAVNLTVDAGPPLAAETTRLTNACANSDMETIICRYPIRETAALTEIAKALRFQKRSDYEGAVRQLLVNDATALAFARSLFGRMYADVTKP